MANIKTVKLSDGNTYDLEDEEARTLLAGKQKKLTPGTGITIDDDGVISATSSGGASDNFVIYKLYDDGEAVPNSEFTADYSGTRMILFIKKSKIGFALSDLSTLEYMNTNGYYYANADSHWFALCTDIAASSGSSSITDNIDDVEDMIEVFKNVISFQKDNSNTNFSELWYFTNRYWNNGRGAQITDIQWLNNNDDLILVDARFGNQCFHKVKEIPFML